MKVMFNKNFRACKANSLGSGSRFSNYFSFCLFFIVLGLQGCSEMNDLHQPYLDEGEYIYAEKVDTITFGSGNERIELNLYLSSEDIEVARIFWNNGVDSVDVDIDFQHGVFSKIIDGLDEQQYVFNIVTTDGFGNKSLPYEAEGNVYGSNYSNTISNRTISGMKANKNNEIVINWAEPLNEDLLYSSVTYKNKFGERITDSVSSTEFRTILENYDSELEYNTVFKPDSTAIDLFYTENVLVNTNKILLDYDEWTIVDFSSQHGGNENSVQNVIDGNQNTRWHSLAGGSSYPHWVIIDLGGLVDFSTLEVLRSTFDGGGDDRATDKFSFEVSTDNDVWVDAGVFDFNRFTNDPQSYHIALSEPVRYVRFTAIEGPEDNFVLGAIKLYK